MRLAKSFLLIAILLISGCVFADSWRISGDLSEACTCDVPCACNFGQAPAPHAFCWALASLEIEQGHYGKTKLDGLKLATASAKNGTVWYVSNSATPEQVKALEMITKQIRGKLMDYYRGVDPKILEDPQFKDLGLKKINIVQDMTANSHSIRLGELGGFQSDYLIGIDGKTPIKMMNNWSWNITENIKAKAKRLYYKDEFGNEFDMADRNANQGRFDWSDQTPIYIR